MGQKERWGQDSGCPSRGHLGSVDFGAGQSLGALSVVDTLGGAVERSGRSVVFGVSLLVLGKSREGIRKRKVSMFEMIN